MDMMTLIIQDPPYGTEKAWNALRLAQALITTEARVNIFLLGDGVGMGKIGQEVPDGLARGLNFIISRMMVS